MTGAAQPFIRFVVLIVNFVSLSRILIKKPGVWIVCAGGPIRCAAVIGRNQRATDLGLLFRIGIRLTLPIEALEPVGRLDERSRNQILAVGPVENEEHTV